jgi:hypothetical protein
MAKKLGIIQTRGIGDIIIALPIADYYNERGWEVFWPVDESFVQMLSRIKPSIRFLPVSRPSPIDQHYFLNEPARILGEHACDKTVVLYSYLSGTNIADPRLAGSLKFDEYKYAIAGVPFERKWQLQYERDLVREHALFEQMKISGDYVCVHDQATYMSSPIDIPPDITQGLQVVKIAPVTDSLFDWRLTLERATRLVMVNSCFANFVDQIGLQNDKVLFLGEPVQFTPVFAAGWRFVFPKVSPVTDPPA